MTTSHVRRLFKIAGSLVAIEMLIGSSRPRIALGIAALVIVAGGVMAPVWATTPFVPETVDATGLRVGKYTSLAFDDQGNPHISYSDFFSGNLKYAVKSGGSWSVEIVDATQGLYWTSLALDGQGTPHILYTDKSSHHVYYNNNVGVRQTPA